MYSRYASVAELITLIDEPNRSKVEKLLADNEELFKSAPGSTCNHQAWVGGYLDHVQEIMNIAAQLYASFSVLRILPFSLSDALLVLFLHDLEKPWVIERTEDGGWRRMGNFKEKAAAHQVRLTKIKEYGIELTQEQENGIKYVEGEHDDYTNTARVMGPLAAFCHMCDVASARIWHDYPKTRRLMWRGVPDAQTPS